MSTQNTRIAVSLGEALGLLGWNGTPDQLRRAAANLQNRGRYPLPIVQIGHKKRVRVADIEGLVGGHGDPERV